MRLSFPTRFCPLVLAALAACSADPPRPAPPAAPAAAAPAAPPVAPPASSASSGRPTLLDEQRRLTALFRGTPVVFAMQSSTTLRVDVPLRFCFDPRQATVKPALAAVLDRLAQSQRDATTRLAVSAPADVARKPPAGASAPRRALTAANLALAQRRAAGVRDRLVAQGIAADRLTVVDSDAAGVSIVVRETPAP